MHGFTLVQARGVSAEPSTTVPALPASIGDSPPDPVPHHFTHSVGPAPELSTTGDVTHSGGSSDAGLITGSS